jgi:hypothetical protein
VLLRGLGEQHVVDVAVVEIRGGVLYVHVRVALLDVWRHHISSLGLANRRVWRLFVNGPVGWLMLQLLKQQGHLMNHGVFIHKVRPKLALFHFIDLQLLFQ